MTKTIALLALLAVPIHARCEELSEGIMLPPTQRLSVGPSVEARQAPVGASKKLVAFAIAGQVLDLWTTHIVVDQRGGFEVNPLMHNRWIRYSTKGFLILGAVGMATGQQMKLPLIKRVPAWKAEGWLKNTGWTGWVPAIANASQIPFAKR